MNKTFTITIAPIEVRIKQRRALILDLETRLTAGAKELLDNHLKFDLLGIRREKAALDAIEKKLAAQKKALEKLLVKQQKEREYEKKNVQSQTKRNWGAA